MHAERPKFERPASLAAVDSKAQGGLNISCTVFNRFFSDCPDATTVALTSNQLGLSCFIDKGSFWSGGIDGLRPGRVEVNTDMHQLVTTAYPVQSDSSKQL